MPDHLRAYVLGLLEARLGRPRQALALADELIDLGEIPHVAGFHLDLAAGLRAEVARLAGDSQGMLDHLAERHGRYNYQLAVFSPLFSQVRERWLRAEALYDLGRLEEADAWYESVAELNLFDLAYRAPALARRAEIAGRLGRLDEAAGYRDRVAELWRHADGELRPMIASAG
jgi:tetratricopeptide (TPR) repeat protein